MKLDYFVSLANEICIRNRRLEKLVPNLETNRGFSLSASTIRSVLCSLLPGNMGVGHGIVLAKDDNTFYSDILIYKKSSFIPYKEGDFVVLPSKSVTASLVVKSDLENLEEDLHNWLNLSSEIQAFSGFFSCSFNDFSLEDLLLELNGHESLPVSSYLGLDPNLFVQVSETKNKIAWEATKLETKEDAMNMALSQLLFQLYITLTEQKTASESLSNFVAFPIGEKQDPPIAEDIEETHLPTSESSSDVNHEEDFFERTSLESSLGLFSNIDLAQSDKEEIEPPVFLVGENGLEEGTEEVLFADDEELNGEINHSLLSSFQENLAEQTIDDEESAVEDLNKVESDDSSVAEGVEEDSFTKNSEINNHTKDHQDEQKEESNEDDIIEEQEETAINHTNSFLSPTNSLEENQELDKNEFSGVEDSGDESLSNITENTFAEGLVGETVFLNQDQKQDINSDEGINSKEEVDDTKGNEEANASGFGLSEINNQDDRTGLVENEDVVAEVPVFEEDLVEEIEENVEVPFFEENVIMVTELGNAVFEEEKEENFLPEISENLDDDSLLEEHTKETLDDSPMQVVSEDLEENEQEEADLEEITAEIEEGVIEENTEKAVEVIAKNSDVLDEEEELETEEEDEETEEEAELEEITAEIEEGVIEENTEKAIEVIAKNSDVLDEEEELETEEEDEETEEEAELEEITAEIEEGVIEENTEKAVEVIAENSDVLDELGTEELELEENEEPVLEGEQVDYVDELPEESEKAIIAPLLDKTFKETTLANPESEDEVSASTPEAKPLISSDAIEDEEVKESIEAKKLRKDQIKSVEAEVQALSMEAPPIPRKKGFDSKFIPKSRRSIQNRKTKPTENHGSEDDDNSVQSRIGKQNPVKPLKETGQLDLKGAESNQAKKVHTYLQENEQGNYPVHLAVINNDLKALKLILREENQTELKNKKGYTPLHFAAELNLIELALILLENGADVNSRTYLYDAPIHLAVLFDHHEMVRVLLEHSAEVEVRNNRGNTPIHRAARYRSVNSAKILIENYADIHARMERDLQPLHLAAWYGNLDMLELLIDEGVELDAVNSDGNTALHFAAFNGQVKVIKALISNKANTGVRNVEGETYLQGINEGYQGQMTAILN